MPDTPEIPAAAILAAAEVVQRHWDDSAERDTAQATDTAREVLAAALPHLLAPAAAAAATNGMTVGTIMDVASTEAIQAWIRNYRGDHA